MNPYPKDTPIGLDDFHNVNLETVVEKVRGKGYFEMWQVLSSAAKEAIEAGNIAQGKVLWLFADACSMMLNPTSVNEPFKPWFVVNGQRSVMPEDILEDDVEFFSQVVEEIEDVWLRARLADLVWLLQPRRNLHYALLAIDAYRMIPLDVDTWLRGGRECWQRAIRLAMMVQQSNPDRLRDMETHVLTCLFSATHESGFLTLWLADLLAETRLGDARRSEIAERLEEFAGHFERVGDLRCAREYLEAAGKWFQKVGNKIKVYELTIRVAETWVSEAKERMSSNSPSHAVAAGFYENAIRKYRSIPRAHRAPYKVDERIAQLLHEKSLAQEKALDEMGVVTSPSMDISKLVETARNAVHGKSTVDALRAFANIYPGARVANIRTFSEKMLQEHPLQALFSATHVTRDGRVAAKRPGLNLRDPDAAENETVVWTEMVRSYVVEVGLVVHAYILPALAVLHLEHRLRESDFVELATGSPAVPPGREKLFGKALFFGYEGDFAASLHLLVPQIEHMVRWHLKAQGVKTTTLDSAGVESENGLSTLMELPETKRVFGEDLAFELKVLLCDAYGPNLRNELAHGLLDYEVCESSNAIYAWWLGLRVVFNTFFNAMNCPVSITQEGTSDDQST